MELVPSSDDSSDDPVQPRWQDERVVGRNRRPMHVPLHAFESAAQALERRLQEHGSTSQWVLPLTPARWAAVSKARPVWPASAARAADWPRLAAAWGSLHIHCMCTACALYVHCTCRWSFHYAACMGDAPPVTPGVGFDTAAPAWGDIQVPLSWEMAGQASITYGYSPITYGCRCR